MKFHVLRTFDVLIYFLLAGTTRLRPVLVNKSFLTAPESMQSHSKNDKNTS